jgi:hypothetical protein
VVGKSSPPDSCEKESFCIREGNNEKTEESEEEKNALLKTHEIKDADGKRKREWKNNGYMYSIMK